MSEYFAVCSAPGCFGNENTVWSVHKTLENAIKKARQSDRLCVVSFNFKPSKGYRFLHRNFSDVVFMLPRENHPVYGAGRYGMAAR